MTRSTAALGGVAVAGLVAACLAWPRINDVETGHTPEYPDLQPRAYSAGQDKVTAAAKAAIGRLPRWTLVGAISGTRGTDLQAEHVLPILPLKDDVTVRLRRQGGHTQVSVRSRSRTFPWDFGQNARNIRELLAELDRQMERPGR